LRCPNTEANARPAGSAASTPPRTGVISPSMPCRSLTRPRQAKERYVAHADDLVASGPGPAGTPWRRAGTPCLQGWSAVTGRHVQWSPCQRRWRTSRSRGGRAPARPLRNVYTTESPSQISRPGTITTCGTTHRPRMLIDRYRVTTDETSGIVNDPNDWCKAHNNPRCVVHLTSSSRPSAWKR
jgi:hypothetical protein